MRVPAPGLKHAVLAAAVALGLGGCVAYPAPGPYGYYEQPYYYGPAYYGPPVVGTVVIGGGHFHHWR
jgi:hypothetical protein